jgi:Ca2+-binding EF-hand superfamily protein
MERRALTSTGHPRLMGHGWYRWALLAAIVLSAAPAALAQTTSPSQAFQATDANGDGRIDRAEFHARMMEVFFVLDLNKDGYLDASELPGVAAEAIRAADGDSDGKLSAIEYINARFREFSAADRDGDGILTWSEVEAYDRRAR